MTARLPEGARARARLILADDHPLLVEGLRKLLADEYDVVGTVGDGEGLISLLRSTQADVLLLDLALPGRNGLDLLPDIRALAPTLRVLVVTMHVDRVLAEAVLHAGAMGFVPKDSGIEDLKQGIRSVLAGERYVSPRVPKVSNRTALGARHPGLAQLTPRQTQILELIAKGRTSPEIAAELGLSQIAVRMHRVKIRQRLGITDDTGLVRFAALFRPE
ncbi:MAG TPA: response regulator transcription factor [Gemmatimonadales bacterium]|nr:response regulator transcription factor [Gemmatimonadales bacterium]